jgi:1-acyl-sn-glycerol-3-phosphate acyltransferase
VGFWWVLYFAIAWLRLFRGYRIEDRASVRAAYRRLALTAKGGLVICSTHPTRADAALLLWALASPRTYRRYPARYPWVVTDPGLFRVLRWGTFWGWFWKCVYVRQGAGLGRNRRSRQRLDRLLRLRETVLIFPEGTRGDRHPSYLVGSLLKRHPRASLLCIGLQPSARAPGWRRPPRGSRFRVALEVFTPRTELRGAHAIWDLARQVQQKLETLDQAG